MNLPVEFLQVFFNRIETLKMHINSRSSVFLKRHLNLETALDPIEFGSSPNAPALLVDFGTLRRGLLDHVVEGCEIDFSSLEYESYERLGLDILNIL